MPRSRLPQMLPRLTTLYFLHKRRDEREAIIQMAYTWGHDYDMHTNVGNAILIPMSTISIS